MRIFRREFFGATVFLLKNKKEKIFLMPFHMTAILQIVQRLYYGNRKFSMEIFLMHEDLWDCIQKQGPKFIQWSNIT